MNTQAQIEQIIEAAIFAAEKPLTVADLQKLFSEPSIPTTTELKDTLHRLKQHYVDRGIELREVASGFRFQAKAELATWLSKLWEEKPPRYSRALMETLAIIAYRQPITRAEIESVRGVAVSSQIVKTLTEREWIRIVGYRDMPGKPALYATTKIFLDYFNLKSLSELPTLAELKDIEAQGAQLQVPLAIEASQTTLNLEESTVDEV